MNLVLDFLFNGFDDNLRMQSKKDYEIEISVDSQSEATTTGEESPSFRDKPTTNIKEKNQLIKVKKTLYLQPTMVERS
jgi:hypothetical protein